VSAPVLDAVDARTPSADLATAAGCILCTFARGLARSTLNNLCKVKQLLPSRTHRGMSLVIVEVDCMQC
jgi:hypothetical protein